MFKKKVHTHVPENYHLISKVPNSGFKKGEIIEVPQGFEALLLEADGGQELIKNQLVIKLENPVQYVYLAKSNRKVIRSNWGTPNRIKVHTDKGYQTIGGFGFIEFQLINPLRFVTTRMQNDEFTDESMITHIALGRIPDALNQVLPTLEPIQADAQSALTNQLTKELKPVLQKSLDTLGIQLEDLVIENLNFQSIEEA